MVSVNVEKNKPPFDEELNIYYVPIEELRTYYDPYVGFIAEGATYGEY